MTCSQSEDTDRRIFSDDIRYSIQIQSRFTTEALGDVAVNILSFEIGKRL